MLPGLVHELKATAEHHEFLNPQCTAPTLDTYIARRAILEALRSQLVNFRGTVLDVGCGRMPYKSLVLSSPSQAQKYIGLDLKDNIYQKPDLEWNGRSIPLEDGSVDCAMATEVLEHCSDAEMLMRECLRVLKPGGLMFLTVPFLWPLHDVPHDEYRYTPFALERRLRTAGFEQIKTTALGGWDRSLAQMIGLWILRRPMSRFKRAILSTLAVPFVAYLASHDRIPVEFDESSMITGLSATAVKPAP